MARAIWSGAINFGLVSVPVKLYTAVKKKDIAFHQVDEKTGARIRNKRVSEKTGREVPYEQIAKGFEVGDDEYVVIEPKEYLAAIRPYDRALALETMNFPDEIVSVEDIPSLPKAQRLADREM